jgi:alanine racemase
MDIVRAGTVLYGQYPSAETPKVPGLNADTFALEARTVFVHDLPAGAAIGYGSEFITRRATRAAVLPVGFFDGIGMQPASISQGTRGIKNLLMSIIRPRKLTVKFGQFNAPVLGRVAMQMIVVDVTDAPSPIVQGDIATVPVRRLAANSRLPRILSNPEALM